MVNLAPIVSFFSLREKERDTPPLISFFVEICFQPQPGSLSLSRSSKKDKETLGMRIAVGEAVHSVTDYLSYSFFSRLYR